MADRVRLDPGCSSLHVPLGTLAKGVSSANASGNLLKGKWPVLIADRSLASLGDERLLLQPSYFGIVPILLKNPP